MKHIATTLSRVFLVAVLAMTSLNAFAQDKKYAVYAVAFYNLENMFDTIHDVRTEVIDGKEVVVEDKNDYEYLPDGANHWNSMKYFSKLRNMAYALSKIATDKLPMGPAIIGLSEVENARVLEDLLKQEPLKDRGWKYIHIEGPDFRGIDCAFVYNPKLFQYDHCKLVPYVYPPEDKDHATRGYLVASGKLAGEDVHFIVNHWPSRAATDPARVRAGVQVKAVKDSLMAENPNCKVFIMGDLNDDPDNKSLTEGLCAKRKQKECAQSTDLWNPWWDTLRRDGVGTLKYNGKWNLFDQIVFTANCLNDPEALSLQYFRHEVFKPAFLLEEEGPNKGYPKRTHSKGIWVNGYSDHLPTIVFLKKQVK